MVSRSLSAFQLSWLWSKRARGIAGFWPNARGTIDNSMTVRRRVHARARWQRTNNTEFLWHQHDCATPLFRWTAMKPDEAKAKILWTAFKYTSLIILSAVIFLHEHNLGLLCKKQTDTHWETLLLILDKMCTWRAFVWACWVFNC